MENHWSHTPRVSVVMAVHNTEKYVQQAIDSILSQTFTDFEFVIVDDGSTDHTPGILSEAAAGDRRIRGVTQTQMRIPRALNRGTELARGKYIARQDSDDVSSSTRLQQEVEFLDSHPDHAAVGSFCRIIDGTGTQRSEMTFPTSDSEIRASLLTVACFMHGTLLIRRSALQTVGGYRRELLMSSDYDMYLRLSERFKIANIPEVLYSHRRTDECTSWRGKVLVAHFIQINRELARQRREEGRDILMRDSI